MRMRCESYAEVSGGAYARAENATQLRDALARLGRETTIERKPVAAAFGFVLGGAALLVIDDADRPVRWENSVSIETVAMCTRVRRCSKKRCAPIRSSSCDAGSMMPTRARRCANPMR